MNSSDREDRCWMIFQLLFVQLLYIYYKKMTHSDNERMTEDNDNMTKTHGDESKKMTTDDNNEGTHSYNKSKVEDFREQGNDTRLMRMGAGGLDNSREISSSNNNASNDSSGDEPIDRQELGRTYLRIGSAAARFDREIAQIITQMGIDMGGFPLYIPPPDAHPWYFPHRRVILPHTHGVANPPARGDDSVCKIQDKSVLVQGVMRALTMTRGDVQEM